MSSVIFSTVFRVYGLYSSDDPTAIRYIGRTKSALRQRLAQHRTQDGLSPKCRWIAKVRARNACVQIWEIEKFNTALGAYWANIGGSDSIPNSENC